MKVAIIGPAAPRELLTTVDSEDVPVGLVGTPVTGLVKALLDLGHSIVLITASPDVSSNWRHQEGNLTLLVSPYRARARERALDAFKLERKSMQAALRSENVDVVHAHWSYEFGWVGVTSNRPNVLSVHDAPLTILRSLPDPYRMIRTLMAYRVRFSATSVTAVSPYLAAAWRKQMLYRSQIPSIPNIVPSLPPRSGPPVPGPVIIDIADSSPRKNTWTLIKAFAILRTQFPDASLKLMGAGLGGDDDLAIRAKSEGLEVGVQFLGPVNRRDLSDHLDEAAVLCHTALEESQPMSLLEAMSKGVPVVAGRYAGGTAWTLSEGEAGVLVDDIRDEIEVAEAVMSVLSDSVLRERIVKEALCAIKTKFSPSAVATAYLEEYSMAIARHANGRRN